MIEILEEFEEGRLGGEPEALGAGDLILNIVKDVQSLDASLVWIGKDYATWSLNEVKIRVDTKRSHSYAPLFEEEFLQWLSSANQTLDGFGRKRTMEAFQMSLPGKLSISHSAMIVVGWEEDESHQDAMLLSIGEVMNQ
jgi:hypothetical protein